MSKKSKKSSVKVLQVLKQNVGADFAKKDFKVCLSQQLLTEASTVLIKVKASRTFKNTLAGFAAFQKWLLSKIDNTIGVHITLEPTGIYHENFIHYFNDNTDYTLHVIVPSQTKAYARSLGIDTKTDKVDAKVLAHMGLERNLKQWKPLSPKMLTIKRLCRERVRLVDDKTAWLNRLEAITYSHQTNKDETKRVKRQLKLLEKLLKEVEDSLFTSFQEDAYLKERIDKITKLKGLGWLTVICIVAETGGFKLFNSRGQLVSYAGYDVIARQSGSSINGRTRISKKGSSYIRRALHFPALSAKKHEPKLQKLYDRVLDRTGVKMKAAVAVQRKLLILIYTLFKKNEEYDPAFQNEKQIEETAKLQVVA